MFTGIIEELAQIKKINAKNKFLEIEILSDLSKEINIGDSIAINGICLTAVSSNEKSFNVNVVKETIEKTFKLSLELCTAGWNTYGAMALPGSFLYKDALKKGIKLPESYEGYSFHSYETLPLPTEKLSAKEVITLRDEAFNKYHNHKPFLQLIEKKFGKKAAENIIEMTKIKLKRKIKGDQLN